MAVVGDCPESEYGDRAEVGEMSGGGCEGISMLATACPGSHKMQGWGLILLGFKSCPLIRFWMGKLLGTTLPLLSI